MDDDPDPAHGGKTPASGHLPRLESGPQAFAFIEQAPVAMAVLDRQMRYLAYSQRWAESHGLGDGDLRGRCHYELFGALPERWHHAHELALSGESVARAEDRIVHPDGRVQWLGWEVQPWYDGPGVPGGVMICTQDITDSKRTEHWLRESEARLRLAAQAAQFGMFDIDLAAGTGHWSKEALALLGLPEDARPDTLEDLKPILDPDSLKGLRAVLRDALRPGSAGRLVRQLRLPGGGGEDRWLQFHGQVTFAGKGAHRKAWRIRGMVLDISDTRRMEQRLSRSERLETVGRLASGIAHDSNNLLTVILSNLELALARIDDPEARRMIGTAVNAAEVNAGFNRRLLSLTCTRSDTAAVLRIAAHLDATQPLLSHAIGDRITLTIAPEDGLWPVRADPGDLDSALLNLALNARDAMQDGGALSVTAKNVALDARHAARMGPQAREGDFVCIEMRDSGTGMSDEVAAQAMEPFFTTKPKGRGTGLGLTSTASFVSRLDGFMTIDSDPGKGTQVALYLPRDTGEAQREEPATDAEAEPMHGHGEVVLLVEDNRDVREAGLKRLEILGYVAIEARDATEALAVLARGEPVDLVFSDFAMPGAESGLSLVQRVRRDYPRMAVLLTTADGTQILRKDGDETREQVEILPKPHAISDLARALRRALDRRDPSRDRPRR
ncbi:PAS/PAC sensor hybrid histidine kinase [Roseovarius litoreus]|uniref:histidine kinase n=1 Tax=Roseovarius litoreus TaxID=1155722 RepID=A0A1M7D7H5_9RHOB|nr:PAS domain S-box protein [Roseovarius litoreus]SHL75415.1 PAS/PAC sensor hybrid histidine kinase [Roseovarius litoreus]